MYGIKKRIFLIVMIFFAAMLSSCARAPVRGAHGVPGVEPFPGPITAVPSERGIMIPELPRTNVIHEVAPGETVWRISKMYDVGIEDIARANSLKDISRLEKGERLVIPNAAPLMSVIPLYPSNKWKYIIVHHSATEAGNALSFDYVHSTKKHWKSLGYHFVIDNGTSGKEDGQIEVSPRWIHQEDGAHCKASEMNYKAIGICLVGNFNESSISPKQMESLVYLVNVLREYYRISYAHILGHGHVRGAVTDCPGTRFPWRQFRSRLK